MRFVLIPGAGGAAWYWHRLVAELEKRGHTAVPVDIREDDPGLGLPEYVDITLAALGASGNGISNRDDLVLVGQSLGGFTVPMVATQVPVRMIVLLNAMIPRPGETPGEWWEATGQSDARVANDRVAGRDPEFSEVTHFLHDVPDDVIAAGAAEQRAPSATPFGQPCDFERWPDVPIRVLAGADDRFFPVGFQRRVARERLGVEADVTPGGHLVALSRPAELADRLVSYLGAMTKR